MWATMSHASGSCCAEQPERTGLRYNWSAQKVLRSGFTFSDKTGSKHGDGQTTAKLVNVPVVNQDLVSMLKFPMFISDIFRSLNYDKR